MKTYHNGPVENQQRSCTDIICLIIFVLFNILMLCFGIYSWTSGNFSRLTTPYDAEGKGCGVDYPDYPYIYFTSPHVDTLWKTVCLKQCPIDQKSQLDCKTNKHVPSCSSNVEVYATTVLRKLCLPKSDKIKQQISKALGLQSIDSKVMTLGNAWVIILVAVPLSIVFSIIFMFIIRLTANFFVYILIIITFVGLIVLGVFLLIPQQNPYFATIQSSKILSSIIGALCIILAVVIAVAFCCFRKRISLASSIVKVSAKFVNENFLMILLPIILFIVMVIFIILWISQALGYYSLGTPKFEQHQLPFQHFQTSGKIKALGLVHLFYLFWGLFFLIQTGDFIVAGASCSWYFQRQSPYSESSGRYLKYHMGSVCLGSFFLALFGFIKFLYQLLTPSQDKQGCLGTWKKFCSCCCYLCITWIFNWFSSGAYTMIHLSSDSYCTSAFQAAALRLRQPVSSAVVAFMEVAFSVLVRLGIVSVVCFICYLILKHAQPYNTTVPDATLPLIVIGAIAFTISSFFVSLYSEGMSSIYVCYLADVNAGGSSQGDKAPQQLKQFLQDARKQQHIE